MTGRRIAIGAVVSLPLLLLGCASTPVEDRAAQATRYESAIASPLRTDGDHRLDASRKPAQFLPFTQARSGMTVMDLSAGGGYTSQLLALAVAPGGKLLAQAPRPSDNLKKRLADHPQADFVIVERPFEDPVPAEWVGKLDVITLVNNYHDITYQPVDRAKMNSRLFAALKPGGHFVIVDHSGRVGTGISEGRTLHRIDEAVVRKELADAGFVLEAEGDFLRNPEDKRDDSSNTPRVPTDKFALRFVKPR